MIDIGKDIEQNIAENRQGFLPVFVGALVVGLMVFLLTFITTRQAVPSLSAASETARSTYRAALAETHTGLRLSRLADFIATYPASSRIAAARVQLTALQTHEAQAWAVLSDIFYALNADPLEKTKALNTYKNQWGELYRPGGVAVFESLTVLEKRPRRRNTFSPPRISAAKSARGENILAGGGTRTLRERGFLHRPNQILTQQPQDRNLATRHASRPKYPNRARKNGVGGQVVLSLDIDANGRVIRTRLVSVSAPRYRNNFVKSARRAAKSSRFYPKIAQGRAVMTHGYLRTYSFRPG